MEQDHDEDEKEEEAPKPKKAVWRVAKEKAKAKEKKNPVEFKENKWNPNIDLISLNKTLEGQGNEVDDSCSVVSSNWEVIRAAMTSNLTLMKNCIKVTDLISTFN